MRLTFSKYLFIIFLFLSLTCIFSCTLNHYDSINLFGIWKFNTKDIPSSKNIDFDDSKWKEIEVPRRIEKQGYKDFNGVGWYRKEIVISNEFQNRLLGIYFSNIADADEIYFNGTLIGESGSFNINGKISPHLSKIYRIPSNLIKYDSENLIAVRFFKQYGPFIGIFNNDPLVGNYSQLSLKVLIENFCKSYLIFFGALLVLLLGLYHLMLYSYLKNRSDYLIFSGACLLLFLYEMFLSFLPYILVENLNLLTKIHFISAILSVFFLFWFVLNYFEVKSRIQKWSNIFVTIIFSLLIIVNNVPNTNLKIFYAWFLFLSLYTALMLFYSIKHVFLLKTKGNYFMPIGLFLVIFASINDMFVTTGVYYFNLTTAYGFLFFVIGISISLANDFANAYKGEALKARTLDNINKTAFNLSKVLNLDQLIINSIDILKRHLQIERCTIVLAGDNGDLDNKSRLFGDDLREPIEEVGWIMDNGQTNPYIMKDIEDTFSGVREVDDRKYRQLMLVPMILHEKRIGLIALSKKIDGSSFTEDDKEFVSIVAPQLALAVENATAYNVVQDQVKRQRDALIMQEKMAAIGQLTSGIGHEINNPVNFIINFIAPIKENVEKLVAILELYEQLQKMDSTVGEEIAAQPSVARNDRDLILKQIEEIKNKGKLDSKLPRILKALDGIADGAKRIANIVDSLKAYSRVGNLPEEIDINDAIDKSLVIIASKLKNRVEVQKEYGENVKAKCYFSINQVIVNLISNAADAITDHPHPASPLKGEGLDRTEKGEIFIKTQNLKDKIRFSVRDTGSGMTEEVKKKLFTPFFTTKGPGKGTGLGLSISYNIVYDQHHGSIDIQSEPGKGTTFTVTIPKDIPTL